MVPFHFQFLENAFSRDKGYDGKFRELISFPPPTKPYFNGSNEINKSHPSASIRQCIYNNLQQTSVPKADYRGNTETSKLHELEADNQRVLKSICEGTLKSEDGQVKLNADGTIESNGEFTSHFESLDSIFIPSNCGFYNGDVLEFLENKQLASKFDIVCTLVFHLTDRLK